MVEYILGNYLVREGKISGEQLQTVLQKQDSVRVKLGLIAVSEGFMTIEQAEEVNRIQAQKDMRFGDIAVEKGYLTKEQVDKLLKKQGSTYLMFVQTLVDEQLMRMEDIDRIMDAFKKANGFGNAELEDIKSDDTDRIVPLYLPDEAKKYQQIIEVAVRMLIRLVDRHIYIEKASIEHSVECGAMASQQMVGDTGFMDCLAEGNGALLRASSYFGQEEFAALDEDALDAAGELLNCLNGLYVSAKSREGQFLELLAPQYTLGETKLQKRMICKVPIFIEDKVLYFIVAELV